MPYSKISDAPAQWKKIDGVKLTLSQINFISKVFDAAEKDSNVDSPGAVAMAQFKETYKKEGNKWVKAKKKTKEEIQESPIYDSILLTEAQFDDEKKEIEATIIAEGWSKNFTSGRQRYYTSNAVESVTELVNEGSKKMYFDHSSNPNRSMRDWAATITECYTVKEGKAKCRAKIKTRNTIDGQALYEDAKEFPEEIGISINGKGRMRTGTMDGKSASIVEEVIALVSPDFVTRPAAGGKVERIAANVEMEILSEAIKTLDQRFKDIKDKREPYSDENIAFDALYGFLWDLRYSDEVDEGSIDKLIDKALKQFGEKIKGTTKAIRKNFKEEEMTLKEMQVEDPEGYQKLEENIRFSLENEVKKTMQEKIDQLEEQVETLTTKVETLESEKSDKEMELKEANVELEKYRSTEKLAGKKKLIAEKLKEAEIDEKVTENFKTLLESYTEEQIESQIKEMAEMLKNDNKVTDNSPRKKKETVTEDEKVKEKENRKAMFLNSLN